MTEKEKEHEEERERERERERETGEGSANVRLEAYLLFASQYIKPALTLREAIDRFRSVATWAHSNLIFW